MKGAKLDVAKWRRPAPETAPSGPRPRAFT
jgi:hypothetical protein